VTTSAVSIRPAPDVRAVPVYACVHLRGDLSPCPSFRHPDTGGEIARLCHSLAGLSRARPLRRRLFAREGAARHSGTMRLAAMTRRSSSIPSLKGSAPHITSSVGIDSARSSLSRPAQVRSRPQKPDRGQIIVAPPGSFDGKWAPELPRSRHRLRVGLMRHPPARQKQRGVGAAAA